MQSLNAIDNQMKTAPPFGVIIYFVICSYLVMVSTPALEAADGTTKPEPDLA